MGAPGLVPEMEITKRELLFRAPIGIAAGVYAYRPATPENQTLEDVEGRIQRLRALGQMTVPDAIFLIRDTLIDLLEGRMKR